MKSNILKNRIEREKLHKKDRIRFLIIDPHNQNNKSGTYKDDYERIVAGDVCSGPAIFEK